MSSISTQHRDVPVEYRVVSSTWREAGNVGATFDLNGRVVFQLASIRALHVYDQQDRHDDGYGVIVHYAENVVGDVEGSVGNPLKVVHDSGAMVVAHFLPCDIGCQTGGSCKDDAVLGAHLVVDQHCNGDDDCHPDKETQHSP